MSDYVIGRTPMRCGSAEAEKQRYKLLTGDRGRVWLVAIQPNAADNIYASDPNPRSEGFAGRLLTFDLEKPGESITLQGPWHSNAGALLEETGHDVQDKHETLAVIAERREIVGGSTVLRNVFYHDESPTIGAYDRGKKLAVSCANLTNKPVICYVETRGGSSSGPVYPDDWTRLDIDEYRKEERDGEDGRV